MLTVTSISHSYRRGKTERILALDDVSFTARTGGITALVGPNGSGKSTLFRAATGVLRPDAGSVLYNGRPLELSDLGVVFQSPSLDGMLSVYENLYHHAMLFGRRIGKADLPAAIIDGLGIASMLDTRVEQLSGGFQRRVELAKALLPQPRVIILDEPFTGLDVHAREQFFGLLHGLTVSGDLTVLLITHELDLATHCEQVVVLRDGRVFADSTPEALLAEFGSTVVEIRTTDPAKLTRRLRAAGIVDMLQLREDSLLLPRISLREVLDMIGDEVVDEIVEARRPTLDDWFIARTGEHILDKHEAIAA